jgi:hypothetical protein
MRLKTADIERIVAGLKKKRESVSAVPLAMSVAGFVTVFQWKWIADKHSI